MSEPTTKPKCYNFTVPESLPCNASRFKVKCPELIQLMDHTVAVVWKMFADGGVHLKEVDCNQLIWAYQFLDGVRSSNPKLVWIKKQISHCITRIYASDQYIEDRNGKDLGSVTQSFAKLPLSLQKMILGVNLCDSTSDLLEGYSTLEGNKSLVGVQLRRPIAQEEEVADKEPEPLRGSKTKETSVELSTVNNQLSDDENQLIEIKRQQNPNRTQALTFASTIEELLASISPPTIDRNLNEDELWQEDRNLIVFKTDLRPFEEEASTSMPRRQRTGPSTRIDVATRVRMQSVRPKSRNKPKTKFEDLSLEQILDESLPPGWEDMKEAMESSFQAKTNMPRKRGGFTDLSSVKRTQKFSIHPKLDISFLNLSFDEQNRKNCSTGMSWDLENNFNLKDSALSSFSLPKLLSPTSLPMNPYKPKKSDSFSSFSFSKKSRDSDNGFSYEAEDYWQDDDSDSDSTLVGDESMES